MTEHIRGLSSAHLQSLTSVASKQQKAGSQDGAPSALVSLIGHRQYRRCASDIYHFLQSSLCMKQLAYGILELLVISVIPRLRDILVDVHKKMRTQPA
ncbi:hypothetical protein Nepgr_009515 [Nepenthes gracilis]|uniref:Uncharacterized protein n=1 Tax=Nepenthes gracilis TaxID=150966 RepID=A0AAD3SBA6_NEPGR|nr:hypothetical protein Nepgr_009515 [Nepenthes gracilis]